MSINFQNNIRPIAIHLPQFHPFPENDAWWGKGFTEWTNVVKARPYFKDHYQPHLPADLGFYDLRLEETRIAQAELARAYGIYGFCYYHYWFNGKRLLQRPLDDMIQSGKPDFPFMLCWANENWTRRWDGNDSEVLIAQQYNTEDDRAHMHFLCRHFFSDSRYIRVNNKPFFIIYRPGLIPDIAHTITVWREEARAAGTGELYIGYMYTKETGDLTGHGFDCSIEFQPDFSDLSARYWGQRWQRALHKFRLQDSAYQNNRVFEYAEYADKMIRERKIVPGRYPGITPMWDNAARRKTNATIFRNSSPASYKNWLRHIADSYKAIQSEDKFIFINAWNEWAEGNHLEPCQQWGKQYLEATREIITDANGLSNRT